MITVTKQVGNYFKGTAINDVFADTIAVKSVVITAHINEAKAHGLPIVGFNISYSVPYQTGVIRVETTNYTQMAEECIKLLKDYNYRKKK